MAALQIPDCATLYSAAESRELDRIAIAQGTAGFELMKRAARAAYRVLLSRWPDPGKLCILCGPGNNGGDGLVMAALALEPRSQRIVPDVEVYMIGGQTAVERLQGEALEAYHWARERGVQIHGYQPGQALEADLIVDAMLGTGLKGGVRGDYADAIAAVNACAAPVLAVDIPSGLCADTGAVLGQAVKADATVSFIGLKRGLLTHRGPQQCGRLYFSDLEVPPSVYREVPARYSLIGSGLVRQRLSPRERDSHKGSFGHLLIIGGNRGMGGAAIMAAEAAVRSGAGLVSVATRGELVPSFNVRRPEVMAHGVRSAQELAPLLEQATTVLIGPGLGRDAWAQQLLQALQEVQLPMVWDADALNLLAGGRGEPVSERRIITPHPGEAARLLGCDTAEVQADRFAAVNSLQQRYQGVAVLKGAGTLVSDGQHARLCRQGNPGMASGGMGDVLAGIIGGLLAQGLSLADAAAVGVRVHAEAGDRAAEYHGERGLLATDLIGQLGELLNPATAGVEVLNER